MSEQPIVSFCMPVHNAGRFIAQTLDAILAQTYPAIEIICVDDHSADDSFPILKHYTNSISVYKAQGRGAAAARNQAFAKSSGKYIVFFDADDLINPEFVAAQLAVLKNDHQVVVSSWGRFYGSDEEYSPDPYIEPRDLSFREWIEVYWTHARHMTPPGRVLVPRALLSDMPLWNTALTLNDDFDFFSRVFAKAAVIRYNTDGLFRYRSGIGGLSSKTKGYPAQLSNFRAIEHATDAALATYPACAAVKRGCANIWQRFIYDNYPANAQLVQMAVARVRMLGGASLRFDGGPKMNKLASVVGWKGSKLVQRLIGG